MSISSGIEKKGVKCIPMRGTLVKSIALYRESTAVLKWELAIWNWVEVF